MDGQYNVRDVDLIVVGAGAVGVACALWLRAQGCDVVILDGNAIGSGASFGNACTLAEYAVTPVAQPSIIWNIPRLLLSRNSPFTLKWGCLPALSPWLRRFLAQCTESHYIRNSQALALLAANAISSYDALLRSNPNARGMITEMGCIYSYATKAGLAAAHSDIELRWRLGISQELINSDQMAELEPAMAGRSAGGIFFPRSRHLSDPQAFVQALAGPLVNEGRVHASSGAKIISDRNNMRVLCEDGTEWRSRNVVVAAGAWSAILARQVGDRIPLIAERGYHLEFSLSAPLLSRPTCLVESGFYMTPRPGNKIRAAGTIELSSLKAPFNVNCAAYIERQFRHRMSVTEPVTSSWLGMRPTLPDYLPVIGRSSIEPRVVYAFGHQHVGMTMAAVTGQVVAGLLNGEAPEWLNAFSPARFA